MFPYAEIALQIKTGEITRFEKDSVVFNDGTKSLADVIVYA